MNESQTEDISSISPAFTLTDTAVLLQYVKVLSKGKVPVTKKVIIDAILREFFLNLYTYSSASNLENLNLEYLEKTRTSTSPFRLHDFPSEIKKYLNRLSKAQETENNLYEVASSIAEWLIDAANEDQTLVAAYLHKMPLQSSRILIAALSDAGFSTSNTNLLRSVSLFLKSTDKRLAQSAATFLITCGETLGESLLQQALSNQELPHLQLIRGISELLS